MYSNEFSRIEEFFKPLTEGLSGAFSLRDDAAEIDVSDVNKLVVTTDSIVEKVHFLGPEKPSSIARKLLGMNLSDLAAKGATPHSYSLSLCLPKSVDDSWVKDFADGLAYMQKEYGFYLSGGDSVSTEGPIVLTASFIGISGKQGMIPRAAMNVGDDIFVSGTIGDGALGLLAAQGKIDSAYLEDRYYHPQARLGHIPLLEEFATSSMDISDGLLGDMVKLLGGSSLSAKINQEDIPLSEDAREIVSHSPELWEQVLTGGDDYELLFTASRDKREQLLLEAKAKDLHISRIGVVVENLNESILLLDVDGQKVTFDKLSYSHS